jgi:hypothetical protein
MSGPYENVQLLDDICRAVMREKETATGCLLVVFYTDGLGEVVTADRDMATNLAEVENKLRKAADKVAELRAKHGNE